MIYDDNKFLKLKMAYENARKKSPQGIRGVEESETGKAYVKYLNDCIDEAEKFIQEFIKTKNIFYDEKRRLKLQGLK